VFSVDRDKQSQEAAFCDLHFAMYTSRRVCIIVLFFFFDIEFRMDFLLMRLSLVCEQCFVQVCLGHLRLRLVIESSAWLVMLHFAPRYCALLKTVPQRGSKTAAHFRATQGHAQ
jgi:hypothetical protein